MSMLLFSSHETDVPGAEAAWACRPDTRSKLLRFAVYGDPKPLICSFLNVAQLCSESIGNGCSQHVAPCWAEGGPGGGDWTENTRMDSLSLFVPINEFLLSSFEIHSLNQTRVIGWVHLFLQRPS